MEALKGFFLFESGEKILRMETMHLLAEGSGYRSKTFLRSKSMSSAEHYECFFLL